MRQVLSTETLNTPDSQLQNLVKILKNCKILAIVSKYDFVLTPGDTEDEANIQIDE